MQFFVVVFLREIEKHECAVTAGLLRSQCGNKQCEKENYKAKIEIRTL